MLELLYTGYMIRHIQGQVTYLNSDHVIIDVSGVGYQVYTPKSETFSEKTRVTLYTHHAVRENSSDLYGFLTNEELEMFELLLTLPKIGPKSALQVMNQADLDLLKRSIITNDAEHLTKLSGIGKKTAEKIVAGLKDKVIDVSIGNNDGASNINASNNQVQSDTIEALVALGYSQQEARKAAQELPSHLTDTKIAVTEALKLMNKS